MGTMEEKLKKLVEKALADLGVGGITVAIERPTELSHGDFATNVALAGAKKVGKDPKVFSGELAEMIMSEHIPELRAVSVAGPGFVNFSLSDEYFSRALETLLETGAHYGMNDLLKGTRVIVEYTDPNPFKEFHIGHLMSNTIGESLARIIEASGAETRRACYQGDVGMQIACAIWGMEREDLPSESAPLYEKVEYLGRAYARGASSSKFDDFVKHEIVQLNKKIYERSDAEVNRLYDLGRSWSLEHFETIYKKLGTDYGAGKAFDHYFFESNTGVFGKELVEKHLGTVFEKSDGAIVYKGDETKGLHTRVFVNKEGLPTYEAKELGLAKIKYDAYPYDLSIVVTGNEVNDYFKVLFDAMEKIFPDLAKKTEHIGHGMMRLPTGKMSSRTGDVVTAESLIAETKAKIMEKMKETLLPPDEKEHIAEEVAIGAIKYSILRQSAGKDIIFEFERSLSFEGDSGPYIQYTHARAESILRRTEGKLITGVVPGSGVLPLHKYLLWFPEVVFRAVSERESHYIATHLILLAREFNSFYGSTTILDGSRDEPYKLALVKATAIVLRRGLWLLGMPSPARM